MVDLSDNARSFLGRLYSLSDRPRRGHSDREKMVALSESRDDLSPMLDSLLEDAGLLDEVADSVDVQRVHEGLLDDMKARLDGVESLSVLGLLDRIDNRKDRLDEAIKPVRLVRAQSQEGVKNVGEEHVTDDVRAAARATYREKGKEFGEALRRDGNLDRFYGSKQRKDPL